MSEPQAVFIVDAEVVVAAEDTDNIMGTTKIRIFFFREWIVFFRSFIFFPFGRLNDLESLEWQVLFSKGQVKDDACVW